MYLMLQAFLIAFLNEGENMSPEDFGVQFIYYFSDNCSNDWSWEDQ